jgi:plasmid stabilization system protein ParE
VEFGKADDLEAAILSLEQMPERCAVVRRLSTERRLIRQLLFDGGPRHTYRIFFTVTEGDRVKVLHIRHGSRRDLNRL